MRKANSPIGLVFAALAYAMLSGLSPPAHAHRYHVTIAEAEYNAETGHLEVALQVKPEDLELALRNRYGDDRAATPEELESRLAEYIGASVLLYAEQDPDVSALIWVGQEIGVSEAWLYFEMPVAGGLEGAEMINRVFFELEPDQVNTVNFKQGDVRFSASFDQKHPRRRLSPDMPDPPPTSKEPPEDDG